MIPKSQLQSLISLFGAITFVKSAECIPRDDCDSGLHKLHIMIIILLKGMQVAMSFI